MKFYSYIYGVSQYIMLIFALIAFIIGVKKRNRSNELRLLFIYPLASFLETLSAGIVNSSPMAAEDKLLFTRGVIHIFLIVEFFILSHFFGQIIKAKFVAFSMSLLRSIYIPLVVIHFLLGDATKEQPEILYIIQGLLILFPSLYYLIELFKQPASFPFAKEPNFWVAVGANVYFACTLPLFLMKNIVFDKHGSIAELPIYSINMLSYSIFFLLITKAYQCKKKEAQ